MSDAETLLLSIFLEHGARDGGPAPEPSAELSAALRDVVRAARDAWPDLGLPDEAFARHLARHVDWSGDTESALRGVVAADLYLACACAHRVPWALRAFERRFLVNFTALVATVSTEPAFVDEVRQILCENLLVSAPGEAPKIAEYAGRGALLNWVRISAIRIAQRLRQQQSGALPRGLEEDEKLVDPSDPMTRVLLQRYGPAFKRAIQDALGALSAEQRNLLRMHYVDGLSIDKIGALQQIHRATAARWLEGLRRQVLDGTRSRLEARLSLAPEDIEPLERLLRSQIDLSLSRILGGRG